MLPGKQVVGLTQPKRQQRSSTTLAKKRSLQTRVIGGWTAIAKTPAALDAVANATSHLADNKLFVAAMNRLPNGALVRAYANSQEAQQLISAVPGAEEMMPAPNGVHFRLKASDGLASA